MPSFRRWARVAACAIALLPLRGLSAQAVPRLAMQGVNSVRTLTQWPGVLLTVDRDAYVAVFAVTRGRRDYPIQVLAPTRPSELGRVKGGQRVKVRTIDNGEMLHLVNWGESPVVVAFASTVAPDLTVFDGGGNRWGRDLLLDTLAVDQQELIDILGKTIFGRDAQYDVVVSSASVPSPVTRTANLWAFDNSCLGFTSRWTRRDGLDGLGLYGASIYGWDPLDPMLYRSGGSLLPPAMPFQWISAIPFPIYVGNSRMSVEPMTYGGGLSGCGEYRVVWWPTIVMPSFGRDTIMRGPVETGGVVADSPVPRLPRYPRQGDGLMLDEGRMGGTKGEAPAVTDGRRFPGVQVDDPRPWNRDRALPDASGGYRDTGRDVGRDFGRDQGMDRRAKSVDGSPDGLPQGAPSAEPRPVQPPPAPPVMPAPSQQAPVITPPPPPPPAPPPPPSPPPPAPPVPPALV